MLYVSILSLCVCCGLLAWNQYRLHKRIESFIELVQVLRFQKELNKQEKAFSSSFSVLEKMKVEHLIELEGRIASLENFTIKSLQHE